MTPTEAILLLALTGYAIYRQTQRNHLVPGSRFKMAIIYGVVGLLVGGFALPDGYWGWALFLGSILLSVVVGLLRGRYTRVWREDDGELYSQGTALTVTLFLLLVASKWVLGAAAYFAHVVDNGGFGEILVMIAIMIAFQAEVVWRRASRLPGAGPSGTTATSAGTTAKSTGI